METLIFGNGRLGRAIASAIDERGWPTARVLERPPLGGHPPAALQGVGVAFEASRGDAVADNVDEALVGGCRRFVIATTAWDVDRDRVDRALRARSAAAVAAPSFSLGVAVYLRLIEQAAALMAPLADFDPFIVEWHRRGKADRPSGTAREILRRFDAAGIPAGAIDTTSIRAGAAPGMHLVGFDAPGETIELRVTARDRSAYAAGALAAADWLAAAPREPGLHSFEEVVDDLLRPTTRPARASVEAVRSKAGAVASV